MQYRLSGAGGRDFSARAAEARRKTDRHLEALVAAHQQRQAAFRKTLAAFAAQSPSGEKPAALVRRLSERAIGLPVGGLPGFPTRGR